MSTVSVLLLADLLAQPTNLIDRCVTEGLGIDCSVQGVVEIRAVDSRRFLVAIDAEPSDGRVDHLFLFVDPVNSTSRTVSEAAPGSGSVVLRYGDNEVEIRWLDEEPVVVSLELTTVAHYWGYGESGGQLEALEELQQADLCDGPRGVCWEADGWSIYFPL